MFWIIEYMCNSSKVHLLQNTFDYICLGIIALKFQAYYCYTIYYTRISVNGEKI